MTTILADWNQGIMVSDSQITGESRKWSARKVWRIHGNLIGYAGDIDAAQQFLDWYRGKCLGKPPSMIGNVEVLVMSPNGLQHYHMSVIPVPVQGGIDAIGTGSVAAIVGYELLGRKDPVKVVRMVCEHDANSRRPVRKYLL